MKKTEKILVTFDLDYTLLENSEGIVNSFNYALKKFDLPELKPENIKKMIGTPLDEMFGSVSNLNPSLLTDAFREYYAEKGIYQVRLLPCAKEKVQQFSKLFKLGVITSKKEEMAKKIVKVINLENYFDFVIGETTERKQKAHPSTVKFIKSQFPGYKIVVIGDHIHDKALAVLLRAKFIGVLSGHCTRSQLLDENYEDIRIIEDLSQLSPQIIHKLVKN